MNIRWIAIAAVLCAFASPQQAAGQSALTGLDTPLPALNERDLKALTARGEAGDLDAMYELAHRALRADGPMYFWGRWKNPREAERWWRKAAARGDTKAMILLGHLYAEPWGVTQDLSAAAGWFRQAAEKKNLEAVRALVDLYSGAWSDARDDAAAIVWLERAASMGDRHAMVLLGLRYDLGWGVREDPVAAFRWYTKALGGEGTFTFYRDKAIALNNLGVLYDEGRGAPKDKKKATALYRQAAAIGSKAAEYNLAVPGAVGREVRNGKKAAPRRDGYPAVTNGQAYKDAATGVIVYVETDGRHVVAISPDGRILWRKDPFVDAGLEPYRMARPTIDVVEKCGWQPGTKRNFLCMTFTSSQFGEMDIATGQFFPGGQD